jgi:hypothetical protein
VNRPLLLISIILLTPFSLILAQTPDWVQGQGKSPRFPDALYLTGYGLASNADDPQKAAEAALANARKNLVEKVRISIHAATSAKTEEMGEKYSSFFASAVQSTSDLEIQGLTSEAYTDDGVSYALVAVKREHLQDAYQQKVATLKSEIAGKVTAAQSLAQGGKSTQALEEYLSCYPLVRTLEEAQSLLHAVTIANALSAFQTQAAANEITITSIRDAVLKLVQRPIKTVDDLAWFLAYQVKEQLGKAEGSPSIRVVPFVYQDTKLGSPFSSYFKPLLEQKVHELTNGEIVQEGESDGLLTGSYWEQGNKVRWIATLRTIKEGRILAGAEATIDTKALLEAQRSLKPANFKAALADMKVFDRNEVAGGGLTLEAWTNKETQGNIFTEGERMKVLVRVNLPSYIRFMYHMADGKRILLLDEYYMDASKVNLAYEIPQEFECTAPFGAEVLQLFARTDKFEPITTRDADGFRYIQDDLKVVVNTTRGMKAAKPRSMQAEQRIVITTMKEQGEGK